MGIGTIINFCGNVDGGESLYLAGSSTSSGCVGRNALSPSSFLDRSGTCKRVYSFWNDLCFFWKFFRFKQLLSSSNGPGRSLFLQPLVNLAEALGRNCNRISFFSQKITGTNRLTTKEGRLNAFLIGGSLGLIWAPCAGPILGIIITLATVQKSLLQTLILMWGYSLGTALPHAPSWLWRSDGFFPNSKVSHMGTDLS